MIRKISSANRTVAGDTKLFGKKKKKRIQQEEKSKGIHPDCENRALGSKN